MKHYKYVIINLIFAIVAIFYFACGVTSRDRHMMSPCGHYDDSGLIFILNEGFKVKTKSDWFVVEGPDNTICSTYMATPRTIVPHTYKKIK